MFKELFKQMPWGLFAVAIVFQVALLFGVIAGAVWIVKAIW